MWSSQDWQMAKTSAEHFRGIPAGQKLTVLYKPLSGILNQNKMLPIRYAPIAVELELVDDPTEPIVSTFGTSETAFKAANTSLLWMSAPSRTP